jgi:integrase
MRPKVRPFVKSIAHTEGCPKRNCGPACVRAVDGWEYHIRQVLPTGRLFEERKKSPLTGKAATQRYAEERANQAVLQSVVPEPIVKQDRPLFSAFWEHFLSYSLTNNRPSTVYGKKWMAKLHLLPHFGSMKLDRIGPAEIEAFKARKLAEGQSKKSINNMLAALRKMLNLAVEWEVLVKAPKVKGFKQKNNFIAEDMFLTFDETDRVLRAAAPEWTVYLTIGVKTGLRVGELLALKWEDLDLVAGRLVVRRTLWCAQEGPPKGGRNREVPLSPEALAALKAYRHLRGPYVFCGEAGKRLTHSMVKKVVPSACRRAGLAKRITNHGMRHTFASHLVMRGVPLKAVQELLGHESIEMTLRYSHLTPDVKRDAVRLLDGPAAGDIRETVAGQ